MSIKDPYHVTDEVVEPTKCLLGRKFKLIPFAILILQRMDELALAIEIENAKLPSKFELEFSQTDSDGNVTIKDKDITLPFMLLEEVK